ncbi:hypothetical protein [Streptomyces gardneri]|uniref:hypothetical protein n=1 Tax=Streptomyces gardneri TaxID=66892 RepID=UPI0033E78412
MTAVAFAAWPAARAGVHARPGGGGGEVGGEGEELPPGALGGGPSLEGDGLRRAGERGLLDPVVAAALVVEGVDGVELLPQAEDVAAADGRGGAGQCGRAGGGRDGEEGTAEHRVLRVGAVLTAVGRGEP